MLERQGDIEALVSVTHDTILLYSEKLNGELCPDLFTSHNTFT